MKRSVISITGFVILLIFAFSAMLLSGEEGDKPFGGDKDIAFAKNTWKALQGYKDWMIKTGYYPGTRPHGKVLRTYFNIVTVNGTPYPVIIKENYGGEDATVKTVSESPDKYLASVTVMVKREDGYDPDNQNWFWAKYLTDGTLDRNDQGMPMAGRVAKGMNAGCISCHGNAGGGDYFYTNDSK